MTTLCLLSARNLGDAVLHASFLRRLQRAGRAERWVVWTFTQASFLFEGLPRTEIVCSDFPMGATARSFLKKGGWRSFFAAVRRIRSIMPDETVDLVGDLRERLALQLIGAVNLHSPEWEAGHPFRHHIRALPFRADRPLRMPVSLLNVYDAQTRMLHMLAPAAELADDPSPRASLREGRSLSIGLHPSASAPFKLWPAERWPALVTLLCEKLPGSRFTLFGAPNERPALEALAARLDAPKEISTGSLREFKARLADVDVLFGLDSFSVHLAHSEGVPSVVLTGSNDPRIFTPPSGSAVTRSGRCPAQPCNGKPSCLGTTHQYSCMIDITPEDAVRALPLASTVCADFRSTPALAP